MSPSHHLVLENGHKWKYPEAKGTGPRKSRLPVKMLCHLWVGNTFLQRSPSEPDRTGRSGDQKGMGKEVFSQPIRSRHTQPSLGPTLSGRRPSGHRAALHPHHVIAQWSLVAPVQKIWPVWGHSERSSGEVKQIGGKMLVGSKKKTAAWEARQVG